MRMGQQCLGHAIPFLKYLPEMWLYAWPKYNVEALLFDHVIHVSERQEREKLDSFEQVFCYQYSIKCLYPVLVTTLFSLMTQFLSRFSLLVFCSTTLLPQLGWEMLANTIFFSCLYFRLEQMFYLEELVVNISFY